MPRGEYRRGDKTGLEPNSIRFQIPDLVNIRVDEEENEVVIEMVGRGAIFEVAYVFNSIGGILQREAENG